ncbi:MAG: hypothetical protein V3U27_01280, partial [Candidatus Tectomicrobia bacterium]
RADSPRGTPLCTRRSLSRKGGESGGGRLQDLLVAQHVHPRRGGDTTDEAEQDVQTLRTDFQAPE